MRFFSLLDFRYYVLAMFLGLITVLLIYLSFKGTPEEAEEESGVVEYPEGLKSTNHPTPPLLLFIYIGFLIWAIIYAVFFGIRGGAI